VHQLFAPEISAGGWQFRVSAIPVQMPETTMNKHCNLSARQYYVRNTGQIAAVKPKAESGRE